MSISISSIAAVIPNTQNTVTISGVTIQSVDGVALSGQPFTESRTCANDGLYTFTVTNGAGESASVSSIKESADGKIVTTGTIYDGAGAAWTVSAGVVKKNGVSVGYTAGVAQLLYYGKKFYSQYVDATVTTWWLWDGSYWTATNDPRPLPTITKWGINGHITWGAPYNNDAAQIAALTDLGMKSYRNGFSKGDLARFKAFITNSARPAGVIVYPVCLPNWNSPDESSAYAQGYTLGQEVANLQGLVPVYEVSNELDTFCLLGGQYNGDQPSHFDNAKFCIARGLIRGVIAGIRSCDTKTPIVGGTGNWLHYGFTDMLRAGTQPDGTTGRPIVDWDITAWHWYSDMGDPENAGFIHANLLAHLATYGKPIWINEYGVRQAFAGDEATRTAYLTGVTCMGDWASKAATYNITHTAMYELFDDGRTGDEGAFGLVLNDGVTPKATRYAAAKSFVGSH